MKVKTNEEKYLKNNSQFPPHFDCEYAKKIYIYY